MGYIEKVAARFGLQSAKPANTFMREDPLVFNDKTASESGIKLFQGMIGSIMFVMIETRPNIAFAIFMIGLFAQNSNKTRRDSYKRKIM